MLIPHAVMQNMLQLEKFKHKTWQLKIRQSWRSSCKVQPMCQSLTVVVYKHSDTHGELSLSATPRREKFREYPEIHINNRGQSQSSVQPSHSRHLCYLQTSWKGKDYIKKKSMFSMSHIILNIYIFDRSQNFLHSGKNTVRRQTLIHG